MTIRITRNVIMLTSLAGALGAGALFFGLREIHKDSEMATILDLPRRGGEWEFAAADGVTVRMPMQQDKLAELVAPERFPQLSQKVYLRDENIQAFRISARSAQQISDNVEFIPSYKAGVSKVVVSLPDGAAEIASVIPVLQALPAHIKLIAVTPSGNASAVKSAIGPVRAVSVVEVPPHAQAPKGLKVLPEAIHEAIYPVRAKGTPLLAYTLLHQWGTDLSWPDTVYLDEVAGAAGLHPQRLPIASNSNDFVLGSGEALDLFVSENVLKQESEKRKDLLLPPPSRQGLANAYKRIFGAKRIFFVPVGPSFGSLANTLQFAGDRHALVTTPYGSDEQLSHADIDAAGKLTTILQNAGYQITQVPASAEQIRAGSAPLSGLFFYDGVAKRKTLIMPSSASHDWIEQRAIQALNVAGVTAIPVAAPPSRTTFNSRFALLE